MKKEIVTNLIKKTLRSIDKKSPTILAGMALTGVVTTAIFSFKAGLKAHDILEQHKKNLKYVGSEGAPFDDKKDVYKDTAKKLVPVLAPTIGMGLVSGGCILGGLHVSRRRLAVLSAAYSVAEGQIKDLNGKMTEILGEKKTREIKDAIVKDKVDKQHLNTETTPFIVTKDGNVPCLDIYSNQAFYSNADKIGKVINKLSARCLRENYVSLNDLYSELGLRTMPYGEDYVWTSEELQGNYGTLPINISAQLTEDGQPVLCLEYDFCVRPNGFYA